MAPEVIKQTGHGRQADIWSVGCTVIEMLTGKPPWVQFNTQVSALFHIASSKDPPQMPEEVSDYCREFLLQTFNRDPKRRPNASKLLQHGYLKDVPDTQIRHTSSFSPRTEAERAEAGGNSFPNLRLQQEEALISSASGDVLQSIQEVIEPPTPKVVELDKEMEATRRRSNAGNERSSDNGNAKDLGVANESTIHQWLSLQADQTADLSK